MLLAPRHLYVSIMRSVLPQEKRPGGRDCRAVDCRMRFNELCGMDEMAGGRLVS